MNIQLLLLLVSLHYSAAWHVMINGLPGPMATAAAEACIRKGLTLAPFGLTGPSIAAQNLLITDPDTKKSASVSLIPANDSPLLASSLAANKSPIIAVDYTHPSAVLGNAEFYVANAIPFVMGSTGGDREKLMSIVETHPAVIAPNMGKQIVALQLALENLAEKFPGCFDGYKLTVTESHQKTKADTSGTCLAVVDTLKQLQGKNSPDFDREGDIELLRDDASSLAFGVPEESLNAGHAHHTYRLTSDDGSTQFELQHDVNGRRIYAEGTADAVKFLSNHLDKGGEKRVYNMIDVLSAGALD